MQKYYLTGFLGSFFPGVIANIIFWVKKPVNNVAWGSDSPFQPFANALIGGFVAGLVGGLIAKKFPRYNDSSYVMLTGILGFIFSILSNVLYFILRS
jgi:hypothetical protein